MIREGLFVVFEDVFDAVVVGFVGDFFDELAVDDFAVFVDDDDSAGQQVGERSVDNLDAIILSECGVAES